jgi:hypothetical protein
MTTSDATHAYLCSEIDQLESLEFIALVPPGRPLHIIEILRDENQKLQVRIPGRPKIAPELPTPMRTALSERGFASEDASDQTLPWSLAIGKAGEAVEITGALHQEIFGEKPDVSMDVIHGSRKEEHEAQHKLAGVRERVEMLLGELVEGTPKQDADGDFLLAIGDVQVTVAPRALPGGPVIVRVFAVTNVNVAVAPELGLFLARLNFGLMFWRFALDAENSAIWFDETLLGGEFSDEELRFAVRVVATTADDWDDRLKQMFGGSTYQEVLVRRDQASPPPVKPGQGRGLYL